MDTDQIFTTIQNFGNDPQAIMMYGGPVAIFFIFLMLVIFFSKKNKPDIDKIEKEIDSTPAQSEDFPDVPDEQTAEEALKDLPKTETSEPASPAAQQDGKGSTEDEKGAGEVEAPVAESSRKVIEDVEEIKATAGEKWLSKLKSGLSKSRTQISEGISKILTGKATLDDDLLEDIHEALYKADVGVNTADDLINHVKTTLSTTEAHDAETVKDTLKTRMINILESAHVDTVTPEKGPQVILVVGVNGVGKTTSIGKLAAHFLAQDKKVLLCAADTFRAAAIDQLKVWGDRLEVDVIAHKQGADPASVAFDGVKAAVSRDVDVLLIDTAGRLHNKAELMDELGKIKRVIKKDLAEAPHETWIVVDSTTGQNASQQVKAFGDVVDLSGIIVTKLDGTAKGGVVVGISHVHKLPIRYIGVGEKAADLRDFKPAEFVEYLL